ncbi:hypothetical protein ACFL16_01175, partial [Patescibacteria group bacterium]
AGLYNHRGYVGELGMVMTNHSVFQKGTIGSVMLKGVSNSKSNKKVKKNRDIFQATCTEKELAEALGLYCYSIRALVCSSPGGIFQIPEELREAYIWLKEVYARIGISCASKVIYNDNFSVANLPELRKAKLSTFFFGEDAHCVRPDRRRLEATRRFNDKTYVIDLARKLNVNTPHTLNFYRVGDVDLDKCPVQGVIKIGNSVSGLGFSRYLGKCDLECKLGFITKGANFQVQEYLSGADFLSMQWWINDAGEACPVTGTCNFIEGDSSHAGNWGGYQIPHKELESFTRVVALEAARQGIRGWLSFDVAQFNGRFYLIECNPRYTGAAYPFISLIKIFGLKVARNTFWASKSYSSSVSGITHLDLGGLEYDFQKKEGWIPINPGPLTVGDKKIALVYVGTPEKYRKSELKLQYALS